MITISITNRKFIWLMVLILFVSGCSTMKADSKMKTYSNELIGIEFQYPEDWIFTDASMSLGQMIIHVSTETYNIKEGPHWPYVMIFALKLADQEFLEKRVASLKEDNEGKALTESKIKLGGKSFSKYETDEFVDDSSRRGKVAAYMYLGEDVTIYIERFEPSEPEGALDEGVQKIMKSLRIR